MTALYLFRGHDLRLADNPALTQALAFAQSHRQPLHLAYVDESNPNASLSAVAAWRTRALAALSADITRLGGTLCRIPASELQPTINQTSLHAVFWNRRYDPEGIASDTALKNQLKAHNIAVHSSPGNVLFEPFDPRSFNRSDQPYRVYTPFAKHLSPQLDALSAPLAAPCNLEQAHTTINADSISAQAPELSTWADNLLADHQAGEDAAHDHAAAWFSEQLDDYSTRRDRPADTQGTSQLSRYLNLGTLSPKQVLSSLYQHHHEDNPDRQHFIRELLWREFAQHILYHFPDTLQHPFKSAFNAFPWQNASDQPQAISAWQQGKTGVPLVDAGMRQLWASGWMHNRVRMIVASWLSKNLRLHWRIGAEWFMHTLIDADIASNTLGWQWVAGCGVDAAPYFRIFNPLTQAEKYDPEAHYLRQWLPELAGLSRKQCFAPWQYSDYPAPMVDVKHSRAEAIAAYKAL